ncbi:unnamed protein product [Mytilus coruscus]|uniref:WSC domain-containing protein n=1 Tax=Mytilus coruscus TaxID=42192 RepID=A0A6J8ELW8_MYTCO|nr:unnamed protein product [Mytilus coruscus]
MGDEREGFNYIYVGCYDRRIRKRLDDIELDRDDKMSPFVCMKHCQPIPRSKLFGITRGNMCMCGIFYQKRYFRYVFDTFEHYKENNIECNIDCFGNRGEKCGGKSTYSMYTILAETSSPVPTSNPTTAYAQGITTDDLNTTSSSIKDRRTIKLGISNSQRKLYQELCNRVIIQMSQCDMTTFHSLYRGLTAHMQRLLFPMIVRPMMI